MEARDCLKMSRHHLSAICDRLQVSSHIASLSRVDEETSEKGSEPITRWQIVGGTADVLYRIDVVNTPAHPPILSLPLHWKKSLVISKSYKNLQVAAPVSLCQELIEETTRFSSLCRVLLNTRSSAVSSRYGLHFSFATLLSSLPCA